MSYQETEESSYRDLVADQVVRLSEGYADTYDPIINWSVLRDGEGRPLWMLPFDEKPVPPLPEDMFQSVVLDEEYLYEIGLPQQYDGIAVEREIIAGKSGNEVLVERLFYRRRSDDGGALAWISLVTNDPKRVYTKEGELRISVMPLKGAIAGWDNSGGLKAVGPVQGDSIRELLVEPLPLGLRDVKLK